MIPKLYLGIVSMLTVLLGIVVGTVMSFTATESPLSQRIGGAVFLSIVWLVLHAGYVIAPFAYLERRHRLAMYLMAVPAIMCGVIILFSLFAASNDLSVTHNKSTFFLTLGYSVCGVLLYIVPFVLMRRAQTAPARP